MRSPLNKSVLKDSFSAVTVAITDCYLNDIPTNSEVRTAKRPDSPRPEIMSIKDFIHLKRKFIVKFPPKYVTVHPAQENHERNTVSNYATNVTPIVGVRGLLLASRSIV